MELVVGVLIGLVGIGLTVFYGIRSKKYEKYLEAYHRLDILKRQLLETIESLQRSNESKDKEMSALRSRIAHIDKISDSVHEGTFNPRRLRWSGVKCPKCGDSSMMLDDVDYWYHCSNCGHEEPADLSEGLT